MSPPAVAVAGVGSAAKDVKRESGTARLLGSGMACEALFRYILLIFSQDLLELLSS